MDKAPIRADYTYRCKNCGFECHKAKIPGRVGAEGSAAVSVTKLGNYGTSATPTPTAFAEELYSATTVSFTAASGDTPAYLTDSESRFWEKRMGHVTAKIRIATDSGTNDGDYTIADYGVSAGTILLSSDDSLTTEDATTAGTVVISRLLYEPTISKGCPFCGTLNSR